MITRQTSILLLRVKEKDPTTFCTISITRRCLGFTHLGKGAKCSSANEPTSLEENVAKVIFYVERKLKIGASDPNSWFSAVTVVAVVCSGS